jgi:hypothetical protein
VSAEFLEHVQTLERSLEGSREFDPSYCGPYHTYTQVLRELASLHRLSPGHFLPEKIGASVLGLPLWGFRYLIRSEELDEPRRLLLVAGVHAQEFIGVEVLLTFLQEVVREGAEGSTEIDEVILVPVLNPDGYRAVESSLLRRRATFRRFNERGVDLNRNFPVHFHRNYWLHRLARFFYNPGPEAASEPETRALMSFAAKYNPIRAISLHSFGECLFWPWSGISTPTDRESEYVSKARRMADASSRRYRTGRLGTFQPWFKAKGSEIDYLHDAGALAFLIEIGKPFRNLRNPTNWFRPFAWYNPREVDFHCRAVCPILWELMVDNTAESGEVHDHS